MDIELYKKLVDINAISGHEKEVRKVMKEELIKAGADNLLYDKLGSIVGVSKGEGPKIMFVGHMDEVGFMVSGISEAGFIQIIPVGGIKGEVYVSQNMNIVVSKDKVIRGIIGSIPPHLSKEAKAINVEDLVLDIGADDKEAAIKMGVQIGQQVVSVNNFYFTEDGKKIVSKAWDNRFGCGLAIEVMRYACTHKHDNMIYCGATVQEEVGSRGAVTLSNMIEPDFFFAFDVTTATDCMPPNPKTSNKLGDGFIVRFYDPGCIMNTSLLNYITKLASDNNIKYQLYAPSGGTDASKGQYAGNGAISTCLAICGRYIHSTATMIHLDDMEAVYKMACLLVDNLSTDTYKKLLEEYR